MNHQTKTLAHYAVIRALEREPQNFRQLLENCHSLFPDQLSLLLNEMVNSHFIRKEDDEYVLDVSVPNRWRKLHADWQENLDRAYELLSAIMGKIHLPHCLDYEWWFSHSGREKMAEILLHRNPLPVPETIAFLGSPLFGAFISVLVPESRVYILDKSKATLDAISGNVDSSRVSLIHYNAEYPLPQELIGIADMAFFDPPWYVEYYDLFLRRCVQLTFGRHSTVSFVLFPILTRPASLQERKQSFEAAMSYGLSLFAMDSHVAHYLTPHFEQETLKQKGIDAKNWRRGDLAVFISEGNRLPENIVQQIEKEEWIEFLVGKVKIKIRVKDENPDTYITPEISDVRDKDSGFPSVSRRDPLRAKIDLWTSTQRGFKIKGCKAIEKIVEGIQNNLSVADIFSNVKQSFSAGVVPDSALQDIEIVLQKLRQHVQEE